MRGLAERVSPVSYHGAKRAKLVCYGTRRNAMRNQENAIYQRALKFLYRRTNYETFKSIPYAEMENSLQRLRDFLAFLGDPERRFVIVHVAGTKGKGSVCHSLDRIYRAAGYRVGLFTSPHLDDLTERFQIDGKNCDKTFFGETTRGLVERWNEFNARRKKELGADRVDAEPKMTFFEWSLVIAVALFARAGVDIAILEVGLGGRFDATNAVDADVSVLTSVSYDHCEQLGDTLMKIAGEKLGIVKTNAPLVSGVGFAKTLRHEPLPPILRDDEPTELELPSEVENEDKLPLELAAEEQTFATQDEEQEEFKKPIETDPARQLQAFLTIDPQTQIGEEELDEVKAFASRVAADHNAPFYQVESVSPYVAALPTPPFDSVRRWNFEIALKVVEVLATRAERPEGRTNSVGRVGALNLPVAREAIDEAAKNLTLPARFEIVSNAPIVVVDGAHNRASVAAFMRAARERYKTERIKVLFASTIGKDTRGMIAEIAAVADEVVLTERDKDERAAPLAELIQTVETMLDETCSEDAPLRKKFRVAPDFHAFLADYCARTNYTNEILCAIGSFYFAAEVRKDVASR